MKKSRWRKVLYLANSWCVFFLLAAFVVTCCMTLFLATMQLSLDVSFDENNISTAAKLTFANVVLISVLFTAIDAIRRKIAVEKPTKRIIEACEKLMNGDFTVRIKPLSESYANDNYNDIIACFNKLAKELSGVETLRTDFIANVSHELKTPLSIMSNYAALLRSTDLSEAKRIEYADGISQSCQRLSGLITNILKLNKLENQQIFPTAKSFNLSEQLIELLLELSEIPEQNGITLETDIEDDVFITSDPELLVLVWNNLLSNAFKFTPCGGTVGVRLFCEKNEVIVTVSDTGCGISPENGAHIFEKFYQCDSSHSGVGNGLGLALVKRVIDILKGEISVESELSKGSAFTVKLRANDNSAE